MPLYLSKKQLSRKFLKEIHKVLMQYINFSSKFWVTKILQNINLVVAVLFLCLYFFLIKNFHHTVNQIFIKLGFASPILSKER